MLARAVADWATVHGQGDLEQLPQTAGQRTVCQLVADLAALGGAHDEPTSAQAGQVVAHVGAGETELVGQRAGVGRPVEQPQQYAGTVGVSKGTAEPLHGLEPVRYGQHTLNSTSSYELLSNGEPVVPEADVVVVGAGLAGLRVADRLTTAGLDVHAFEASDRVGGRVRASGAGHDLGAAFVGRRHRRLRALLSRLGLEVRPSGLMRGPVRWAVPARARTSWLPPHAAEMAATALRLQRLAGGLDPARPWTSGGALELDGRSFADFVAAATRSPSVRHLWTSLIEGFATVPAQQLSLLQVVWWVRRAGGVMAALRSGSEFVIDGGAHQIPARLAARLPRQVTTSCPVRAVRQRGGVVEVDAGRHTVRARHVVVAVPLPTLRDITFDPPLPPPASAAVGDLSFGAATKIVARIDGPMPRHRTSIGDPVLPLAWRIGSTAAAMCPTPNSNPTDLATALGRTLDVPTNTLADIETFAWHAHPWTRGTYLAPRPGALRTQAAGLDPGTAPVWFAAAERSSQPTSMEGALEAADTVADHIRGVAPA